VIGAPSANRDRLEVEGLIGFFVNALALRVEVSDELTVRQLLQRTRRWYWRRRHMRSCPLSGWLSCSSRAQSKSHADLPGDAGVAGGFEEATFDLPDFK